MLLFTDGDGKILSSNEGDMKVKRQWFKHISSAQLQQHPFYNIDGSIISQYIPPKKLDQVRRVLFLSL